VQSLRERQNRPETPGLVHRDIKPSNIIFVNGALKLADVGCVTDLGDAAMSYVRTEGFIPPEGPGTMQADIYSLGKVLYEISTENSEEPGNIIDRRDAIDEPFLTGDWKVARTGRLENLPYKHAVRTDA
jgi:serine/threonine protein kinase